MPVGVSKDFSGHVASDKKCTTEICPFWCHRKQQCKKEVNKC